MRKKVIILILIGIILLVTGIIIHESNNKQLSYIKYNVGSINDDMVAITDDKKIGYLNINTNEYELKYDKNRNHRSNVWRFWPDWILCLEMDKKESRGRGKGR